MNEGQRQSHSHTQSSRMACRSTVNLGVPMLIPGRPVPKRGTWGNDILGPQNPDRARQEPDTVLPPETDAGKMPNMKWSVLHSRLKIQRT